MTDRAELQSLYERVLAAEGPDRELDSILNCQLVLGPPWEPWGVGRCIEVGNNGSTVGSQYYTASIDAALDLAEGVLPSWMNHGHEISNWHKGKHGGHCHIFGPSGVVMSDIVVHGEAFAATEPLAILAATLKALMEKEDDR